jgi:AraC-like DNA-binding protein
MNEIMKIDTVQQYNDYFGIETSHPLVSVIEGKCAKPLRFCKKLYNVYTILLKDTDCGNLKYGQSIYDYQRGAMLFLAPGQVMGSEDDGMLHQPEGWVLAFHPELLRGTLLASLIKEYSYFSYNANEALHLSGQERRTIIECMEKVRTELQYPIDKHSKSLIIDNIKLLLDYCIRFYDRQFITRENVNKDVLTRFESLLDDYFSSDAPAEKGMPTVQYCADKLCLSANYFSDLCRKETGMSALKHIQQKVLDVAKEQVFNTSKSISEISYELGFPYPQHFSRWFKKMAGITPNEYRQNRSN